MPSPIIVFDLDGTLIDTAPDLVGTLNTVLRAEGLAELPFGAARELIGGGARLMLERGLERNGVALDPARVDRLFAHFLDHYSAHIADQSRPFAGLEAALDDLAGAGFTLAVCTNKLESLARQLLDALELSPRFAVICGQDTFGTKKPDPVVWQRTLAEAKGDSSRAVMVGDSVTDIRFARAAGAPVIAVDFGYTDIPVAKLDPDRIISHFDDLGAAVDALLPDVRPTSAGRSPAR
jgi:phosphoglycolate phosphatase